MSKELSPDNYIFLEWDSEHFGYNVAKIPSKSIGQDELGHLLGSMTSNDIKLCYWFVEPDDQVSNQAAISSGGFLADKKITFATQIPVGISVLDGGISSYLNKPPCERIIFLGLEAGLFSRYKIDPNFVSGEYETLYTLWTKKSLSGELSQEVLVYKDNDSEVGLLTIENKNGIARIGILAVDPDYRGVGIGKKLVNTAFEWARKNGYKEMDVVTQLANERASGFYRSCGFEQQSMVNIYHFWL